MQGLMSAMLLLICFVLAAPAAVSVEVTPVEQVVQLLKDLRNSVTREGSEEASTYKAFACFCKSSTETKSTDTRSEADNIDELASRIGLNTATRDETKTNLAKRKKDQDGFTRDLAESKAVCAKQKAEYEATSADLGKALRGLGDAINSMEQSKLSFLQVRSTLEKALDIADTVHFAGAPTRKVLRSLLQQHAQVNPDEPEYGYQSQHIIDVLKSLQSEYSNKKSDVEAEWGKTQNACEAVQAGLDEQMRANTEAMVEAGKDIERLTSELATDRGSLLQQQASSKDSQLYIKDLTARCEQRARDWDQRSQMRHAELMTLNQAIDILENQVAGNATANVRALLLQKTPHPPPVRHNDQEGTDGMNSLSFLQAATTARIRIRGFLERAHGGLSVGARKEKALEFLRQDSKRLGSMALSSLVQRVAADPFKTVKVLIQKLIERLVQEAAAEATKEGFCDEELGKSRLARKYRWRETSKLLTKIGSLNAKRDKLTEDIETLGTEIQELNQELEKAGELRTTSHAQNVETIDKANKGVTALREAVEILKAFYKRAANAEVSFLQESPVDADTTGAGFAGAYRGKQESSIAIFGLLEVLESDFERTLRVTTQTEQEEAAAFVVFKRDSQTNIAGKNTKLELNSNDLTITKTSIETASGDLQENQDLVDNANKEIEALKSVCIDTGMSYSERVAKRKEEIDALKRALCMLDTDNVEEQCGSA